ncbi:MAG: hypothetical protein KAS32_04625 [Candidatus Peribacteraceae bacterium]|nr:hypothetical protein [Candidatus Peribacteraceae bacterium]
MPKFDKTNTTVDFTILFSLPRGVTFLELEIIKDMSGKPRRALKVMWQHSNNRCLRKAHFCADNGDYLGEA